MNTSQNKRMVSICLRDFALDPDAVRSLLGADCIDTMKVGDRTGTSGIIRKNFVGVWELTYALESWDEAIERLVNRLGGLQRIGHLVEFINPRQSWLQIDLPAIGSPYVETNRIDTALLRSIASAGLGFELEVFTFSEGEPTHHPRDDGQREQKRKKEQ